MDGHIEVISSSSGNRVYLIAYVILWPAYLFNVNNMLWNIYESFIRHTEAYIWILKDNNYTCVQNRVQFFILIPAPPRYIKKVYSLRITLRNSMFTSSDYETIRIKISNKLTAIFNWSLQSNWLGWRLNNVNMVSSWWAGARSKKLTNIPLF